MRRLGLLWQFPLALLLGSPGCVTSSQTVAEGPDYELVHLIEHVAADGTTSWDELRTVIDFEQNVTSVDSYPPSYSVRGVLEDSGGMTTEVSADHLPDEGPRELEYFRLRFFSEDGPESCIIYNDVLTSLEFSDQPPHPGYGPDGSDWGKVASGKVETVEVVIVATSKSFPCVRSVQMTFEPR